jgi:hypothetical protein
LEKVTSFKTSPKETNLVKKYCEVRKITLSKTSPKKTTLVKNNSRLEKSPRWKRQVPRKITLLKKLSARPCETLVRVGVFVIPDILFRKN